MSETNVIQWGEESPDRTAAFTWAAPCRSLGRGCLERYPERIPGLGPGPAGAGMRGKEVAQIASGYQPWQANRTDTLYSFADVITLKVTSFSSTQCFLVVTMSLGYYQALDPASLNRSFDSWAPGVLYISDMMSSQFTSEDCYQALMRK